ncbi:MAG: Sporulation kinase A [Syntrophorhabdaceae bacterium PtaU1.Bin034]|nr:MAG: Sporulation kinase A [Syntrophorhabdaceae bacterium PtaU1.Bin034]
MYEREHGHRSLVAGIFLIPCVIVLAGIIVTISMSVMLHRAYVEGGYGIMAYGLVLPAGLLAITFLLALYLQTVLSQRKQMERTVLERTAELRRNEQHLEEEIRQRTAGLACANDELTEKTMFLEALVHSSPVGIMVVDSKRQRILQNRRYVKLRKLPPYLEQEKDEMVLLEWLANGSEDPRAFREKINYLYDHPEEVSHDEIKTADGTILERTSNPVFDSSRKYYGRIWTLHDITERKRAEEALRESENKFRDLAEKSIVGIFVVQDDVFRYVNARFAEIHGYRAEEMISANIWGSVLPEDLPYVRSSANMGTTGTKGRIRDEFRIIAKNGEVKNVEVYGSRTVYNGKPAVIGSLLDVTERKATEKALHNLLSEVESKNRELEKAYDELKTSQKKIFQQEKMASIGQLAAGVAHEINNPIGFIMSNLNTLQKYMTRIPEFIKIQGEVIEQIKQDDKEATEALVAKAAEIRRSLKIDYILEDSQDLINESLDGAGRVKRIVQDLKSFSHADQTESALVDLNRVIDSTLNIVWNELKYKATAKKEYGDIPMTNCNAGQLGQVFMNILVNAAQAIETSGEITIKTRHDDGYIEVTVSDTGCGISQEHLGRIFEPFFTTKEIGKGTGLGLSIAYDIVKKHKGEIEATSQVGKGTTFVVRIPAKGV